MPDTFIDSKQATGVIQCLLHRSKSVNSLLFNHLSAWAMSLGIGAIALVIHQAINPKTLLLLAGITVGYWLAFALNDYYDVPFDAQDRAKAKGNFFVRNPAGRAYISIILLIAGIGLIVIFGQFGLKGISLLGLCFVVMWMYSAPPLRLKSRPIIDLLTHAIFVEAFPYFICLILIETVWTKLDYVLIAGAILSSLSAQLEQQLRDFELDSKIDTNFTTVFGRQLSTRLLIGVTVLALIIYVIYVTNGTVPLFIGAAILVVLPIIFYRFWHRFQKPPEPWLTRLSSVLGLVYVSSLLLYFLMSARP